MDVFQGDLLEGGYISNSDCHLFRHVQSADQAIDEITRFYKRFHSARYVGEQLVIRLNSGLEAPVIEGLRSQFSDILARAGTLALSGPLPEEADRPDIAHLP